MEEEMEQEQDMELERICLNCTYFFIDCDDQESGQGVCMQDDAFEPYADQIVVNSSFASCRELYLRKKYDNDTEACPKFEEIEMMDETEYGEILLREAQNQNLDSIIEHLENDDPDVVDQAIVQLSNYFSLGNSQAIQGLVDYYESLPPAEDLEEVHRRMKLVSTLADHRYAELTVPVLIKELSRTPSNQTTRQLYTSILQFLQRCPLEITKEPLQRLLENRKYGHKMKEKIIDIIIPMPNESPFW